MISKTTNGVLIQVRTQYVPEESNPQNQYFFFAYTISIKNLNGGPVQLLNRHWIITDGHGKIEEVRGPGVVGQQPCLNPNDSFEYTSYCPLRTPTGSMRGSYQMSHENNDKFDVEIPEFELIKPGAMGPLH